MWLFEAGESLMVTYHCPPSWLNAVWGALDGYREDCIPEGLPEYDAQWDDICFAMARITESLGLES
jgi:hypothetical protein